MTARKPRGDIRPSARQLREGHPGCGLVSKRNFEHLRAGGIAPGPISVVGNVASYPEWTRELLVRYRELQQLGVRGARLQRMVLWLDGYPIRSEPVIAELKVLVKSIKDYAASLLGSDIDKMVIETIDSKHPSPLVRLARRRVGRVRADLEQAFMQMAQIGTGTAPADLAIDEQAAGPLQKVLVGLFPALDVTPQQLATAFEDKGFNDLVASFFDAGSWSAEDWEEARREQMQLQVRPPADVRGRLYYVFRVVMLLGCGAIRKTMDRQAARQRVEGETLVTEQEAR